VMVHVGARQRLLDERRRLRLRAMRYTHRL
jgi:hypothetical protein